VLTPLAVKNLHLTFDSHKILLIVYWDFGVGSWFCFVLFCFRARGREHPREREEGAEGEEES